MRPSKAAHIEVPDLDEEVEDLDDMDSDEQAALLASIDRGLEQAARGEGRDAREVLAALRARRPRIRHG